MTSDQLKLILFLIGGGAFLIYWAFQKIRTRRRIEDTPTSRTRSAAQGLNEFQGYAWPLSAPAKCSVNNECVYYHIGLERYEKRGKSSTWVRVYDFVAASEFLLLDATGAVQVIPQGSEISTRVRTTNWSKVPEAAQKYLMQNYIPAGSHSGFPPGSGFMGSLFGGNYRIVENYILLGSPILVLGHFDSTGGAQSEHTGDLPLNIFYEKIQTDARLKIGSNNSFFDLNKDGSVDEDELRRSVYYMARSAYGDAAQSSAAQKNYPPISIHGLVQQTSTHKMIILDTHEQAYRRSGQWYFYLSFLGGVGLILAGLYLIINSKLVS